MKLNLLYINLQNFFSLLIKIPSKFLYFLIPEQNDINQSQQLQII